MTDRIPPHNIEAEQRLLGAIMLNSECLDVVMAAHPKLDEFFFDFRDRNLFEAIRDSGQNDPIALQELLRQRAQLDALGGLPYISGLINGAMGVPEIALQDAEILSRDYTRRKLLQAAHRITESAYHSESATETLETAEKAIMEIGEGLQSDTDPDIGALINQVMSEFEAALEHQGKLRGLSTGYPDLDWMTQGWKPGQMIVLAARPGVGKTSLAMNIAEHVAIEQKYPVGVFSLEMTGMELTHRMACSRARVDSMRAQAGRFRDDDFPKLTGALAKIKSSPLKICEKGGLTIGQLGARARRMHQRHKLRFLVIDYLQLMSSRIKGNRNDQITEISNGIKTLAKDLKIPILALAQLNRSSEQEDRSPRLSDLRDSGSIEQDADMVILLSPEKPTEGNSNPDPQRVHALIPKHRGGPTGAVELNFLRSITRFESLSRVQD